MAGLAEALLGLRQQKIAQSPSFAVGKALAGTPVATQFGDPWSNVAAQVGTSLLGAALASYGQSNAESEYNDMIGQINSGIQGGGSLSQVLQQFPETAAVGMQMEMDAAEEQRKLLNEMRKSAFGKGLNVQSDGSVAPVAGYGQSLGQIGLQTAMPEYMGKKSVDLQFEPQIAAAKQQAQLQQDLKYQPQIAAAKAKAEGTAFGPDMPFMNPATQKQMELERQIQQDFGKKAEDYRYQEKGFKAMVEAYKDQAGTSDFELIRRASQAVEPGLAVRKDDQDSIERAAALFGQYGQAVKAAADGQTRLTEGVRQGIMRIAARALKTSAEEYGMERGNAVKRAIDFGLNPDRTVYQPPAQSIEEIAKDLNPAIFQPAPKIDDLPPGTQLIRGPDGKTYLHDTKTGTMKEMPNG